MFPVASRKKKDVKLKVQGKEQEVKGKDKDSEKNLKGKTEGKTDKDISELEKNFEELKKSDGDTSKKTAEDLFDMLSEIYSHVDPDILQRIADEADLDAADFDDLADMLEEDIMREVFDNLDAPPKKEKPKASKKTMPKGSQKPK